MLGCLEYLRICSHVEDFIDKTKRTRDFLIDRGYNSKHLKFQMEEIVSKNSDLLHRLNLFSFKYYIYQNIIQVSTNSGTKWRVILKVVMLKVALNA